MAIEQIATRFTDHPDPEPVNVPIEHPYRRRWWLSIVGPTATCILDHHDPHTTGWIIEPAQQLAVALGLGNGTSRNSPLIRSFERLTRFGLGHFDAAPGQGCDPCITLYRTVGLVPERFTRRWPTALQTAHAVDLADLHRRAS